MVIRPFPVFCWRVTRLVHPTIGRLFQLHAENEPAQCWTSSHFWMRAAQLLPSPVCTTQELRRFPLAQCCLYSLLTTGTSSQLDQRIELLSDYLSQASQGESSARIAEQLLYMFGQIQ